MSRLKWDDVGKRFFETGVDRGVLYVADAAGTGYLAGKAWNGLINVTESPTGAEVSSTYADNIQYLNLVSREWFGASIEAYTYPQEFAVCDGTIQVKKGLFGGQQARKRFALAYRTLIGNDVAGEDLGYKIHLVYGCLAAPSEKAYATINDSTEAMTFSWDLTTQAPEVPGLTRRTAILTVDTTVAPAADVTELETILYGADAAGTVAAVAPRIPLPAEVVAIFDTAAA